MSFICPDERDHIGIAHLLIESGSEINTQNEVSEAKLSI
jgi:hypothetical protein